MTANRCCAAAGTGDDVTAREGAMHVYGCAAVSVGVVLPHAHRTIRSITVTSQRIFESYGPTIDLTRAACCVALSSLGRVSTETPSYAAQPLRRQPVGDIRHHQRRDQRDRNRKAAVREYGK